MTRLGAGAAAFSTVFAAGVQPVTAQSRGGRSWQPMRHSEDDWFDQLPGVHRFIFDNINAQGFGQAMRFANNYINVNKDAYGVEPTDLAVVIVARSRSTAFAFNDAIWEKYGVPMAARTGLNDPKTDQPPTVNLYNAEGYGGELPNGGLMLKALFEKGLRLAVCSVATRGYARSSGGGRWGYRQHLRGDDTQPRGQLHDGPGRYRCGQSGTGAWVFARIRGIKRHGSVLWRRNRSSRCVGAGFRTS